jgi:hypothetical protein
VRKISANAEIGRANCKHRKLLGQGAGQSGQ